MQPPGVCGGQYGEKGSAGGLSRPAKAFNGGVVDCQRDRSADKSLPRRPRVIKRQLGRCGAGKPAAPPCDSGGYLRLTKPLKLPGCVVGILCLGVRQRRRQPRGEAAVKGNELREHDALQGSAVPNQVVQAEIKPMVFLGDADQPRTNQWPVGKVVGRQRVGGDNLDGSRYGVLGTEV